MTYDRVNWQNEPSENTPLSAENLNKMDSAIKELSEMIVANPIEADTDELKKIEIEGTIYKIAGGHELVNSSGSTMTQRSKMEFLDTHLTDDSVNNTTKVQVTKEVTTAQFSSETEEGLYFLTDMPDSVVTAEQVAYDSNNSVKDMLDSSTDNIVTTDTEYSTYINQTFSFNVQKVGNIKILNFSLQQKGGSFTGNWHTIGRVPNTKYKPSVRTALGFANSVNRCQFLAIETNGDVSINVTSVSSADNGATLAGQIVYV